MPLAPGIAGLQRRLLVPLLLALMFTVAISVLVNQRSAGDAALEQDQRLLRFLPLMSGSVVKSPTARRPDNDGPTPNLDDPRAGILVLLAPPLVEFLEGAQGTAGYAVLNALGERLAGDPWLPVVLPLSEEPEFQSLEHSGVTYRLVAQRVQTDAGEVVVMLAAATDGRQRWLQNVLERVLLPNLLLFFVAAGLLLWGVNRALRPLMELRQAVENRSPRDLSPIEVRSAPLEVRPLVEALNRLFDLVNAQTQAQRRFVADAAHQLRTPLAGVQAQVEAWAQAARQLDGRDTVSLPVEQVRRLRDAARRTSQLANQLLALSRTDTLRLDDQPPEQIDLEALCEDVLAQQLDAAAAKRIDIGLQTVPTQTRGQGWLLRELLINLVDNAIKYTPAGGRVTIRCGVESPRQVWLEVEDNGPGIAPAERGRVLQRFYRVPGTQGEGNGLGLAIADGIARVHGTQLQFDVGSGGLGLRVRVSLQSAAA